VRHTQEVSIFWIICKGCLDSEVLQSWPKSAEDAHSISLRCTIQQQHVQTLLAGRMRTRFCSSVGESGGEVNEEVLGLLKIIES